MYKNHFIYYTTIRCALQEREKAERWKSNKDIELF